MQNHLFQVEKKDGTIFPDIRLFEKDEKIYLIKQDWSLEEATSTWRIKASVGEF